jgi:hypothetical protein
VSDENGERKFADEMAMISSKIYMFWEAIITTEARKLHIVQARSYI